MLVISIFLHSWLVVAFNLVNRLSADAEILIRASLIVTVKNCAGICVISDAVVVSSLISSFFCSAVSRPLSMDMYGIIL